MFQMRLSNLQACNKLCNLQARNKNLLFCKLNFMHFQIFKAHISTLNQHISTYHKYISTFK